MKWCVLFSADDAGFDGLKLHMVNRVYSIDRGRIEVWVDNDVDVINIVDHSPIGFKVQPQQPPWLWNLSIFLALFVTMVISDSYQFSNFFDLPCFLRGKVYCCCCRRLLNFIWYTLLLSQMYKLSVNETDEGERYIDYVRDVNSKRFKALWLNRDNYSQIIRNFIPNQSKYGKISHKMLGITLSIRMTL